MSAPPISASDDACKRFPTLFFQELVAFFGEKSIRFQRENIHENTTNSQVRFCEKGIQNAYAPQHNLEKLHVDVPVS